MAAQTGNPNFGGGSEGFVPPPISSATPNMPPSLPHQQVVEPQPVEAPSDTQPVPQPNSPQESVAPSSGGKRKYLIFVLLLFFALILGVGGFLLFKNFSAPGDDGSEDSRDEIVWWGLWEEEAIVAPLIREYEELNPKVKVTYVSQSKEDYRERLTSAMARGDGPDIFRFHNTWVPMFANDLDVMPAQVMSEQAFLENFYFVSASDLSTANGIVGIPLEYDGLGLYINEDIFSTFAQSVPASWEDLRDTAQALTVRDGRGVIQQAGVALGRTENIDHWPEILGLMMIQNGVNLNDPRGELAAGALEFFTRFSREGVWDATLPNSTTAFAGGKVAMYFAPSWRAFEIQKLNPNLRFSVHSVPQLPKVSPDEQDTAYASYWVEGVWSRSDRRAQAWDFLAFLSKKESLEKLFASASTVRSFGEPYPRVEMAESIASHPFLGGIIEDARFAESWYLADRTFDGTTGINSQMSGYFLDAVNSVNSGKNAADAMDTAANGVRQVLSQYGLAPPPLLPEN